MLSRIALIAVVLAGLAATSGQPAFADATPPRPIFPYPIRQTTLDNGLVVLSVPFDSPGIIAYYTVVRTGSRNEVEKGLSGFAHFFEHMMFRGTPRYSQEAYNDELKKLGADSNAFTTDDWTCYHMTIPASALATAVTLESDRFQNLQYDEPAFQKEARAVLGEYNKSASSPFLILNETMQDKAYTTHTYKHTTIGFLDDVKDMPNQYAYSKTFFDRWYRPDNCTIIVAGDVDHDALVRLCREAYGAWKPGTANVEIPAEPPQTEERTAALTWPTPTLPLVYLGYHIKEADPKTNPDYAALAALSQAVFGETSPLYKRLVLDEQSVVTLFADAEQKRDPGLFTILARVKSAEQLADVQSQIEAALADAAKNPIPAERLDAIKSHLRFAFAGSLDSADAVAQAVGASIAATGRPDAMNELYTAYDALTPADLQRVAATYFAPHNRTVVTLTAQEDAPAVTPKPEAVPAARIVPAPLRQVSLPSASSPLTALRVIVRVGSQDDPPGKEGLAALTAAMVAQGGTQALSYDQILQRFYPMAAALSGDCRKEVTVFAGEVHRDNLDAYAALLNEMITTPRFDPADFERLKTEALDYLTKILRGSNDEELGKAALELSLYPANHPYGHVETGTVAGLNAITLDDVKAFHKARYTLSTMEIGTAGGTTPEFLRQFPAGFIGLDGPVVAPPDLPPPPAPDGLEVVLVHKPSADATAISLGFPLTITRKNDDFYALALANSYLGEHRTFNGKLMQDLRGKRGLNYGDYSYIEHFIQDGYGTFPVPNNPRRQQAFTIWLRPVPHDKAVFALRAALWELDRLVNDGIAPADFEATRDFLQNYSKLWVQTLSRRLGYAMDGAFYGRNDLVTELAERLPKLTVDAVNAAVKTHLTSPGMRVVIVTPDAEGLAKILQSGEPTPIVYDTAGTPEDVLREDKVIERFPLGKVRVTIVPVETLFESK